MRTSLCTHVRVTRVLLTHTYSKMPTRWQTHISNANVDWDPPGSLWNFNKSSPIPERLRYCIQFQTMQINFVMVILQITSGDAG